MLNIFFGYDKDAVLNVEEYFKHQYEVEWFRDEFVKEMVKGIDKSVVLSEYCIQSPVLGQISPLMLSGGVKTLILLLKQDGFYPDLVNIGENCCSWLCEISKKRDIRASLSGVDLLFRGCDVIAFCENDSSYITGRDEWCLKMCDLVWKEVNK